MIELLSVENMRKSDAHTIEAGTAGRELMMRAGKAVFGNIDRKPPAAIVCGTGNNAGDGYVIAGLMHDAGMDCTLVLLEEKFSADGRYYFDICREKGIDIVLFEGSDESAKDSTNNSMDTSVDASGYLSDDSSSNKAGLSPDSAIETEPGGKAGYRKINEKELRQYSTIVDCLFGTGFKGTVRGRAADLINAINSSGAYVVSVDINSGLNGDTGMADLCVRSDLTVSIGSFKPGHFLNMAKDVMKRKVNCDIGIKPVDRPFYLVEKADFEPFFTPRPNWSHKGTYGYVALIGGSKRYSGAIRLAAMANAAVRDGTGFAEESGPTEESSATSRTDTEIDEKTELMGLSAAANAAMRAGAGVVKIAVPDSLCPVVSAHVLESTLYPLSDENGEIRFSEPEIRDLISNVKTVAFGMGIGVSEETAKVLDYLLDNYTGTLIIDADGLTLLSKTDTARIANAKPRLVLTPHVKEFSRLLEGWCKTDGNTDTADKTDTGKKVQEMLSTPIESAMKYASAHNAVLLLKGPSTVITNGSSTYITDAGCAGMATAGSGDVLSGILSAVCAYLPECISKKAGSGCRTGESEANRDTGAVRSIYDSDYDSEALTLAVAAGAYINGKAGELAQERINSISMIASDTVSHIAEVISEWGKKEE